MNPADAARMAEKWNNGGISMAKNRVGLLGLSVLMCAGAQTFPQEFRTSDEMVKRRVQYFLEHVADEYSSMHTELEKLIALPAKRVYRSLDAQARAAALKTALPLLKQMVMSEDLRKAHDEMIARQYGAVDHGLNLPYHPDPNQRLARMGRQLQKNFAQLINNRSFHKEFERLRREAEKEREAKVLDGNLRLFTMPLPDVKRELNALQSQSSNAMAKKCYEEAAPAADSDPERFRLLVFRCAMIERRGETSEAEADRFRKERAQKLYDEMSVKGATRKTLREFLETASTVDFSAVLKSNKVFVKSEYEDESTLWKLIYRNGKEPTEVAVQFAKAWLAELEPPAPAPAPATVSSAAGAAGKAKPAPAKAAPKK